jgi:predicted Zn-dependent peptidase
MWFAEQSHISNGLRVILVSQKNTQAITTLALLPVGSRYETASLNGASHFVEHMLFKGTKRRPSSLLIAQELDGLGAEYNAFTAKDHTGYWIKAKSGHLEKVLDVLADMLFNSLFDENEFERERGVILEEIRMREDNPMMYIEDFFEEILYGKHPLGWLISGDEKTIKKIKRSDLLDFKNKFYQPHNILLVLAGEVKKKESLALIRKFFTSNRQFKREKTKFLSFKKFSSGPHLALLSKETKQVQIALGVPTFSYSHPDYEALVLLSLILGGSMSSRLFTEVRVKRGLAYFINSDLSPYQETGSLVIRAGLDRERIIEALGVIIDELRKLKKYGVSQDELFRAKDYFEGKLLLSLEDSINVASWYGKSKLLLSKIISPEEKIKKIKAVKKEDIQRIACKLLQKKALNLAIIGPFKNRQSFLQVLERDL